MYADYAMLPIRASKESAIAILALCAEAPAMPLDARLRYARPAASVECAPIEMIGAPGGGRY